LSKIWITADQHWNHAGIIRLANRKFDDINHLNEHMISEWNAVVRAGDDVYHLGDFTRDLDDALALLLRLNGRISIIRGNHDRWIGDLEEDNRLSVDLTILPPLARLNFNHTKIWLSHYPLRAWEGSFKGSMHVYGHTHNTLEADRLPRSMDIGVDAVGFRPLSIEAIWRRLDKDPILPEEQRIRNDAANETE
jgi:calcineurin-like phosphoesterase family protein